MNNTLIDGDRVLVNKRYKTIIRDEIVIFKHNGQTFIKRCIGLPGEEIQIKNNQVYINNAHKKLKETMRTNARPNLYAKHTSFNKKTDTFDIMVTKEYGELWTRENFGPYIIPKKGVKISLTAKNLKIYKSVFDSEGFHPTQKTTSYTVKNNYYFLLGDNRLLSDDSRVIGVVNESDILGKTDLILFSGKELSRWMNSIY